MITKEDFFNPNKIKFVDGIAGAGKSTMVHNLFEGSGSPYEFQTATNALSRAHLARFSDIKSCTICSGAWTNEEGFYTIEKLPECMNVIHDELLLTTPKMLDYYKHNVGKRNFVILTDLCQLLTPKSGESFLEKTEDFIKDDDVIYECLTHSYRAAKDETGATTDIFNILYKAVNKENAIRRGIKDGKLTKSEAVKSLKKLDIDNLENIKNRVSFCNFSDINDYDPSVYYITHLKAEEDYLYRLWHISEKATALVPKGTISKKQPKDISRIPVESQLQAEKNGRHAYFQAQNVGVPHRMQGQEISGKMIYFYEPQSRISVRELYTVITRCTNIKNVVFCEMKTPDTEPIKVFMYKPVKQSEILKISTKQAELDGVKIEMQDGVLTPDCKKKLFSLYKAPAGKVYNKDIIIIDGEARGTFQFTEKKGGRNCFTTQSIMKRENLFDYSFMSSVYKIFDKYGIMSIKYPRVMTRNGRKEKFTYEFDLYSAYISALKFGRLPIDGAIYEEKEPNPEKLNFYSYFNVRDFTKSAIFTDALLEMYLEKDKEQGYNTVTYLFSTDFVEGCKMGDYLYDLVRTTTKNKTKAKDIHWGFYEKKFLEPCTETGEQAIDWEGVDYFLMTGYTKELLMVAVLSEMHRLIYDLCKLCDAPTAYADAVYFNNAAEIEAIKDCMAINYKGWDYRIKDIKTGNILYKSYKELPEKRSHHKKVTKE